MAQPPFTVDLGGKTYTVNPADYPADCLWLPLNGPDRRANHDDDPLVCRVHRLVFRTRDVTKFERRGEGASAAQISHSCGCADCYWSYWRPPKQTEIGLESLPSWWEPGTHFKDANTRVPSLFCTVHKDNFNLDECCPRCVHEDDARESE